MAEESSVDALRHEIAVSSDDERRCSKLTVRLLRGLLGEIDLDDEERSFLFERRKALEDAFYSEALYALTRRWVSPPQAHALWNALVEHRDHLGEALGRRPGLLVAAVDFLTNLQMEPWNLVITEATAFDSLQHTHHRDGLTLLHDRESFDEALLREIDRARRYHRHLAIDLVEIDDLASVAQSQGRVFADYALREVAAILEHTLRSSDLCSRFRGDQFTMLLPESNVQRAFLTAERVRRQVERNPFVMRPGQSPFPLTVSIGVAEYPIHGRDVETLVESAESALRLARESGRNRVCLPPRIVLGA
jgi:diguanylate cyclase (GGDEF)-like protein